MSREALILIGHGAHGATADAYAALREDIRKSYPDTYLLMLHGEPSAQSVIPALKGQEIREAFLFPLFLSSAYHYSRDISAEDGPVRGAFSEAGIHTELIGQGLLEAEEIRAALKMYCLSRLLQVHGNSLPAASMNAGLRKTILCSNR